ncbi:MAG: hypothetical protein R3286_01730 [Gammaproteobacteria bacterium]|nr:hypothetical protein [Gammaproteobacteria bacterium]
MTTAKAFAPGNVSCVFKIVPHDDPAKMHSLGMGFTVSEGVTATVARAAASRVTFNGAEFEFPTVHSVIEELTTSAMEVTLASELPISGGFGLSGASALATAFAINELLGLEHTEAELGLVAHVAEVRNLTGLGDVGGQFHGGCLVKLVRGDPLGAIPLPVPEQLVYYRYFSAIHTKSIIGNPERRQRINDAADVALAALERLKNAGETDFNAYISIARRFSEESGLLADAAVRETIATIEKGGGHASMIMLGNAVFSSSPFPGASTTRLSRRRVEVLR